jgi:hypothetical protein
MGIAVCLIAVAAASGAGNHKPPAKDTFAGEISTASGRFAGDAGRLRIILRPGRGGETRRLRAFLYGDRCGGQPHCLRVHGRLDGTLSEVPTGPDRGKSFKIDADGNVAPAGQVSAGGRVTGTGFIAYGHEQLRLKLSTGSGRITITASSKRVRGFTSP